MRFPDPPKGRVIEWQTDTFDVREITNVYLIVEWWTRFEWLAHTMLSFEFSDGRVITPSVEIRPKRGQVFGPIKGLRGVFEIHYVWSTEADALLSRMYAASDPSKSKINLIEAVLSHQAAVRLFEACVTRTQEIHSSDQKYHSLNNSCTTNVFDIAQQATPDHFKRPTRLILPGYTPRFLARAGALRMHGDFKETLKATHISERILEIGDVDDFSSRLRGR
jgi:hypothetical protein